MLETMTYAQALNRAMYDEFEADQSVFAFGVDIDDHKRTFGSGEFMVERFGNRRYFSTPVSEAALTGIAVGAALNGMKPVQIHARADFMLLCMNQLINNASIQSYLSQGNHGVPLTVRCMIGRSWGQGPQHSKALHGTLAHFPGLKVIMPSTPQDAYSMLRAAIQDPNPVIVFEHRWLYDVNGEVDTDIVTHLDGPRYRRIHRDSEVTLIAASWMVVEALQAANILSRQGIEADVIDIRSAAPLDTHSMEVSVRQSHNAIVIDNDWLSCGLSAEIATRLTEECFNELDAPVARLGFQPIPCPTTRPLEELFYPTAKDIVRRAEKLLGLDPIDLSGEVFNEYGNRFRGPF